MDEFSTRPIKVRKLQETLNRTITFLETMKLKAIKDDANITTNSTTDSTNADADYDFDFESMDKVRTLCNDVEHWLTAALDKQAEIKDHEEPYLLTSQVDEKIKQLQKEMYSLMTPRRKPSSTVSASSSSTNTVSQSSTTLSATSSEYPSTEPTEPASPSFTATASENASHDEL
jgi:hypothetical protein